MLFFACIFIKKIRDMTSETHAGREARAFSDYGERYLITPVEGEEKKREI